MPKKKTPSAPAWTPQQLCAWLSDDQTLPPGVQRYTPPEHADQHTQIAKLWRQLPFDPTPLPHSPDDLPLLP